MTYTLTFKIHNSSKTILNLVEQACMPLKEGSSWTEDGVDYKLTVGSATGGESGAMMRFRTPDGMLNINVAVGFCSDGRPWCDIQADTAPGDTAVKLLPQYYYKGLLWNTWTTGSCVVAARDGHTARLDWQKINDTNVVAIFTFADK